MEIKTVSRDKIKTTKRSSPKYKPLLKALEILEIGGDALELEYGSESELNSMRNVVYDYNRRKGVKVRSSVDSRKQLVYFYRG